MRNVIVRVFEVEFPNGTQKFEIQYEDGRYGGGCEKTSEAAMIAHNIIARIRAESKSETVKILISHDPSADYEFPEGLQPRRCLRPALEKQDEFWKHFAQIED